MSLGEVMAKIKITEIRIDGGTQGRDVIDQEVVRQYVEAMRIGDKFPPLQTVYDGTCHWLVDGFHRYFAAMQLGMKEVGVDYQSGTQLEAQVLSFGVNSEHGLQRTKATKRKIVESALVHPMTKTLSNYEIAKICRVSQSFVASIRSPEVKAKQEESKQRHIVKKAQEIADTSQTSSDVGPDPEEIRATEIAVAADMEAMQKLLASDDALATAHEEIKRLNHLNGQLEMRLKGLMNEKNEAIKMVKKLQKDIVDLQTELNKATK